MDKEVIHLKNLCKIYLNSAMDERLKIRKQIDNQYLILGKDKEKLQKMFYDSISDFKLKYSTSFVGITDKKTNALLNIDLDCSEKARNISLQLEEYITNLPE